MAARKINEEDLENLAIRLWEKASKIKPRAEDLKNNWYLSETQINALPRATPKSIAHANSKKKTAPLRNAHLRKSVSPYLKGDKGTPQTKLRLFEWIVGQWGGIQSHSKKSLSTKMREWRTDFGSFTDNDITYFQSEWGNWNVSSWSKVAAFADYKKFPIFDARAAIALNILLHKMRSEYVFYMPPSQNRKIHGAYVALGYFANTTHAGRSSIYLRYDSYLALLRAIRDYAGAEGVMEVEMHLYSIAPKLAEKFWEDKKHLVDDDGKVERAERVIAKNKDEEETFARPTQQQPASVRR
jgi:hypothetical protein